MEACVKLIDFGLADTDSYAMLKEPAGTDGYISPEQQKGGPTDVRNDIYSVGVILDKMKLGFLLSSGLKRCLRPLEERYPNYDRHAPAYSSSASQFLLAFWISSGMLAGMYYGGAIYNKGEPASSWI